MTDTTMGYIPEISVWPSIGINARTEGVDMEILRSMWVWRDEQASLHYKQLVAEKAFPELCKYIDMDIKQQERVIEMFRCLKVEQQMLCTYSPRDKFEYLNLYLYLLNSIHEDGDHAFVEEHINEFFKSNKIPESFKNIVKRYSQIEPIPTNNGTLTPLKNILYLVKFLDEEKENDK